MFREGKLSPEEKEQVVQRCRSGELGVSAAGRLAGVDKKLCIDGSPGTKLKVWRGCFLRSEIEYTVQS